METIHILLLLGLGIVFIVVIVAMRKKESSSAAKPQERPVDLSSLTIKDARARDIVTIHGAGADFEDLTINAGKLRTDIADALSSSSGVTLADTAGAVFDLNDTNQTIAGLSGGGSTGGNITLGSGTLTVDTTSTSEFAGVISETGGLTKSGSGNLELSGNNTYSGGTSLSAGTLTVGQPRRCRRHD